MNTSHEQMKREIEATHVSITVPDDAWSCEEEQEHSAPGWTGCFGIVLDIGSHIWIQASYAHGEPKGVTMIKQPDVRSSYDWGGNCVLAVPAAWCKFHTPEEAHEIMHVIAADMAMLDYARG